MYYHNPGKLLKEMLTSVHFYIRIIILHYIRPILYRDLVHMRIISPSKIPVEALCLLGWLLICKYRAVLVPPAIQHIATSVSPTITRTLFSPSFGSRKLEVTVSPKASVLLCGSSPVHMGLDLCQSHIGLGPPPLTSF